MPIKTDTLLSEYIACQGRLFALLQELEQVAEDMPCPKERLNWAMLGDYKRLECMLEECERFTREIICRSIG